MAEIRTFKGVLYNKEIVEDLATVVAPPYDVISDEEQRQLLKESKYNVVRLILPQGSPNDTLMSNKYVRARNTFIEWLEKGILLRDTEPAIYIYEQEYSIKGVRKKRTGFIALAKIEDFSTGKIKAHEKTLKGPKADRLRLLKACGANFSQIFSLFSDPEQQVDAILYKHTKDTPRIDITVNGVAHRLWALHDHEAVTEIAELMRDRPLYIADGHHRYETALNYRDEMRQITGDYSGEAPFDYTMMMFVNMDSEGLTILPTHRALKNLPKINHDKFRENLEQVFEVEKLPSLDKIMSGLAQNADLHSLGIYLGNTTFYLLRVKDENSIEELLNSDNSRAWKLLDVTILHHVIINRILGFGGTNVENSIKFTIDEQEAVRLIMEGTYQMAFFLNPTKVGAISEIASAGEVMPQKSTYFYPKLLSGLVFNKLEW
ncbi:MAG TPA: DUF1015 domain-containing protein [Anaerolineae bacterium]|nr:DUF1015 domain-containing protein [Anaerolineae bacterium]